MAGSNEFNKQNLGEKANVMANYGGPFRHENSTYVSACVDTPIQCNFGHFLNIILMAGSKEFNQKIWVKKLM